MNGRKRKSGQIAILLVLLLAGLVMLFALNVDIFTSSRSKIRLQNAADASALTLARWQGITLNMIGELNLAHLAAVCNSNKNAIAGAVALQRRLAFIGPTMGFKAANDIAKANGIGVSQDMALATKLVSEFTDDDYQHMLEVVLRGGIRVGVDNAAILRLSSDLRLNPDFYAAIKNHDFRTLCLLGGGAHHLPNVPKGLPDFEEEVNVAGCNACFGNVGVKWESGASYASRTDTLADFARSCGLDDATVSELGIRTNATLLADEQWCIYDPNEWRNSPAEFRFGIFPWLTPPKEEFDTTGGSATIRIEGWTALTAAAAQTNYIAAQAAARALGSVWGRKVTASSPPLVLPCFEKARLVPFGPGAGGRYGMSNIDHIRSLLGILADRRGTSTYLALLDTFHSTAFRCAAEAWYSSHGHTDANGCCPPNKCNCCNPKIGGGTPYAY